MKEKKSYIKFNLNSKSYIYPFLLPIACTSTHFFQKIFYQKYRPENSYKIMKYNLPLLFYYFLPKIFSIIFIMIVKFQTKEESSKVALNKVTRRYHLLIENDNKKKIILIIYLISFLEVLFKSGDSLIMYLQKINKIHYLIEKRAGFIIFVPLFSYFILDIKLCRHHWLALIISLIGVSIITISRFILGFSFINEYLYHLLNLLISSMFSFSLVLIKYLMSKYFIPSPYTFLFYDGIFCIINSFITVLIFEYPIVINIKDSKYNPILKNENNNYFSNNILELINMFKEQDGLFYISFSLAFASSFGYFIFNAFTIFHFLPYLNVLTDFITPFLYEILNFFFLDEDKSSKNILRYLYELIGFVIIIFGALVLNEIIILNFLGLSDNTYSKIVYRGSLDFINFDELTPTNESIDTIETHNEVISEGSTNIFRN